MQTAQEVIAAAEYSGDTIMVLVEGDWFPVRWLSHAYDGSDHGKPGFGNEDDYLMDADLFEDARNAGENDDVLTSDAEQHIEDVAHRVEAKLSARLEARRRNDEQVRVNYEEMIGDSTGVSVAEMRKAVQEAQHSRALRYAVLTHMLNQLP